MPDSGATYARLFKTVAKELCGHPVPLYKPAMLIDNSNNVWGILKNVFEIIAGLLKLHLDLLTHLDRINSALTHVAYAIVRDGEE